jgi:hypothetical protein
MSGERTTELFHAFHFFLASLVPQVGDDHSVCFREIRALRFEAYAIYSFLQTLQIDSSIHIFITDIDACVSVVAENLKVERMPKLFSYKQLKSATNDFHDDNKLGEARCGAVFKVHR